MFSIGALSVLHYLGPCILAITHLTLSSKRTEGNTAAKSHTQREEQILPVANATVPYWRTEWHWIDEHRLTPELPAECDIAIIGAGLAGVSTAYHIRKLTSHLKAEERPHIVIVEARQVCSGATGRNGGHIKTRTPTLLRHAERYGPEQADEYAAYVDAHVYAIKHAVEAEGLDCEFELRRSYDVFVDREEAPSMKTKFSSALEAGHAWTKYRDFIDGDMAEQVTAIRGAKAAISCPIGSFWPYKFVSQLLAKLVEARAVNVHTNTPVQNLTYDHASSKNILHTPREQLKAKEVVFATNGYTAGLLAAYKDQIVPTRGTACHIVPTKGPIFPHLSHTYNINYLSPPPSSSTTDSKDDKSDAEARVDYLNPRPDPHSSIIVGGGKWTYGADRSLWDGNWDDATLIPEVFPHFDGLMQRHFLGWEEARSGARMVRCWTGIQGYTGDGMPHVGRVVEEDGKVKGR
ncbi:hypothetical protein BAUCODRAFT_130769 [Baudoinia panamericana UAMH 10762]|uniref:FAD dependent oxidoreductase domain-containing protein n=1 Tax=Baudoinia panamericana (strain UAMH 10762) TaxID=717646 RepID=M2N173_BAUPA|nr:uncharacterized protein BAUCODRAFT_130769 [Baudoinia panamericana UAMH 10762]EMC97688.1 hypothetical protein BAUCODRAFT_130769 [Baudoinia panamericana UAMH 10762]